MSEIGWIRMMQNIYSDEERSAGLANAINADFDKAQATDLHMTEHCELAWRQAYIHQLAKIATGREEARFGPLVHPVPGDMRFRLWTIFYADAEFEMPLEEEDFEGAMEVTAPEDEVQF